MNYFSGDSTKNTYSMNINGMHIVVLNIYYNNSTGKVSQAMYDWLDADIKAAIGLYKIVITHDPMYPIAKHTGNSLDADKAMRDKLQNMFIANKVNVFLGGHTHYSSVQLIGGIYHVCTGVIGPGTSQGEDPFASLNYIYIDSQGNLKLVRKQDSNNSWLNPKIITHTIGTPSTPPTEVITVSFTQTILQ
jgi:predicted phosphodiesterase